MDNIAIIGAGQLGSRHLQAMTLYKDPINIYIIDPSEDSINTAVNRFEEVDQYKNKTIKAFKEITRLPSALKFVVVSTNSVPRLNIMEQLLSNCKVDYLLLEKFLFPEVNDYSKAFHLIENHCVSVYVNCTRRMWPNYQEIKQELSQDTNISVTVEGANWGLASNTIHFLDLFNYLTNETEINLDSSALTEILTNKRRGYIELAGTLIGRINCNTILNLTSSKCSDAPLTITIKSNERKYTINETQQQVIFYKQDKKIESPFKVYYQSEVTNMVFEQLKEFGCCSLTSFKESAFLHVKVLEAFNKFLGKKGGMIT
ncbi:Gfo/Idh/MocA family oxidoreductase [Domibacillus enclensis]|uniref:Oxidoreductase family, NAD-binding Rossmann fold n=1 Tax=Domibacillus enclensis TaxID=1017273 RepID=A0A1N6SBT9_9BACI|nr:Gfo/Idh/MocA family oxidoreductase [Domibacillus enclensis]SIQ38568.1 Oxidoreductase family, NAD-binding Rossmann fold [Domibacillus enclensis]